VSIRVPRVSVVSESESLHARVREFAAAAAPSSAAFESLATDIARFQFAHHAGFRRLVESRGGPAVLASADGIPAVPVAAFRLTRVAVHPPELDLLRFETSGTTSVNKGVHAFRTANTYRALSLAMGRRALVAGAGPRLVVALAPDPGATQTSSLGFMMRTFMEAWDGRGLSREAEFDASERGRFLVSEAGIDVEGLERALRIASVRRQPVLLLSTSFALVLLLDALAGTELPLPPGSVVMQTGGFKGKTREVSPEEILSGVARSLRVSASHVVTEYGMTELSSQLYDGRVPGAELQSSERVLVPPHWLRVTPVDPVSLVPTRDDEPGIARFVYLGNVDSAVAIVTQDRVRRAGEGIELLGRLADSEPRGCSLSIEEMVLPVGSS